MENTNLKALLNNLRHATEFLNAANADAASAFNGTGLTAIEWVQTAALELGNALIAQHQTEQLGQEPILVEAVAVTRENDDGELYLDWLLEGGIAALELPDTLLLVAHGQITDDEGSGEVYAVPVAQPEAVGESHE